MVYINHPGGITFKFLIIQYHQQYCSSNISKTLKQSWKIIQNNLQQMIAKKKKQNTVLLQGINIFAFLFWMFMAILKAWWMNKKTEMSSVAKYAKPFYFQPFLMMQLYKSFRVVEHHEIEHQETSHQMLWSQLESKFTMNANHVLIIFKLILLYNSCDHFLNRSTKWLTVAGPILIFSPGKSFFNFII